jgi:hypothetical protein
MLVFCLKQFVLQANSPKNESLIFVFLQFYIHYYIQ